MRLAWSLGLLGLALAGLLAAGNSCSTLPAAAYVPPEIPGAHFVGNQACYDCHTNYVRTFPASAHGRIHRPDLARDGATGCESCHGPGSKHVEAGGGRGKFIINPRNDPSRCFQCHLEAQAEFQLPQHHPVVEGRMQCTDCHDPHGGDIFKTAGGPAMARLNDNCAKCHREQTHPFVFEHEALREGCITCHQPHGSINRKLLVQSDANLCLRCHAQVQTTSGELYIGKIPHAALLQQGSCWSAGCHTAIHGSNLDPRMRY